MTEKQTTKIAFDIAKHNSGFAIHKNNEILTGSLKTLDDFIKFFMNLEKNANYNIIIEISNNFSGKYNSNLQHQILGVIFTCLIENKIDYELNIIYPSQWTSLYPQYKKDKKFIDKKERVKKIKEDFGFEVKNDDEADAFMMLKKFDELWEKSKKNKKIFII